MSLSRWILSAAALGLGAACEPQTCEDAPGVACVYAGTGALGLGEDGLAARDTELYWALDMEFAPDGTAYLLDWNNHLVRRVRADGTLETVIGDFVGDGPPDMSDLTQPGAAGTTVRLNHPTDIQFDEEGRLILAAWHNHKLRVWDPETGLCFVMAGRGAMYAGDGAGLAEARFNQPKALVRASDGTLYVLDQRNFRVRRISPTGELSTVAGTGVAGYSGDGGPAIDAQLTFEAGPNPEPSGGLALSADERTLYIGDGLNFRIRRVDLDTGLIDTVVGTGTSGYSGDGGPGAAAQVTHVRDVEVGPDGRVYFADTEAHVIRAWDPAADVVETVVGSGAEGMGAEGVPATDIALSRPMGIAFGPDGALYVADTYNSRFLRIPAAR